MHVKMKKIETLEEKQAIALNVLKHFVEFCDKHEVNYMLAYGTLLGAVRHNGFIPWDDDVDVMMLRDDYIKLMSLYDNNLDNHFKVKSSYNDNDYYAPLAKMYDDRTVLKAGYGYEEHGEMGIYIDIFVIDNMPSDENELRRFYENCQRLRYAWKMSILSYKAKSSSSILKIIKYPIMAVCKLVGYRKWIRWYDILSQKYNDKRTEYAGVVVYGEGAKKERMLRSMFTNTSNVEFEGLQMKAPSDVDAYLRQMYGDYMKLPPENERKVHPSNVYWKDGYGE